MTKKKTASDGTSLNGLQRGILCIVKYTLKIVRSKGFWEVCLFLFLISLFLIEGIVEVILGA